MNELNILGVDASFHHVGMAVESIRSVSETAEIFFDKIQNVSIAFVSINGIQVELIESGNGKSPITESLKKNRIISRRL